MSSRCGERRSGSLTACSAVVWVARQLPAERGERAPQYFSGVPGPRDPYPGTAEVVIDPVRGAVWHRLVDGVEDLPIQVAVGEVDRFCAFPGRSGHLRIRNCGHTGMVPPGPGSCQPSVALAGYGQRPGRGARRRPTLAELEPAGHSPALATGNTKPRQWQLQAGERQQVALTRSSIGVDANGDRDVLRRGRLVVAPEGDRRRLPQAAGQVPGPGQGDHPLFSGQTYRVLSRRIPDYRQTGRISGKISSQSEPADLGRSLSAIYSGNVSMCHNLTRVSAGLL